MKITKTENPDFLNEYILYLKVVKNYSQRTIDEYYMDIRLFLRYILTTCGAVCAEVPIEEILIKEFSVSQLEKITLRDIYEYAFYLADERGMLEKARARKMSALRSFFKYLTNNLQILKVNPAANIEMPSIKKAIPKYLSLDESLKLLSAVDSDAPERDYCIIVLFLNCGMRLSELVGLNINSIDFAERRMRLLGKGNKERIIYISDACADALHEYLAVRPDVPTEPHALFLSKFKRRISSRRVQQIVTRTLSNAELDGLGYSAHKLRHTAATLMYQHGGVDTLVLKEILGHKSITTTEIYTHISNQNLYDAAMNSPLAGVKRGSEKRG